jgi:hypothetical protein
VVCFARLADCPASDEGRIILECDNLSPKTKSGGKPTFPT